MNMIDINVLKDLTNAFGPSGFEEDVVRAVRDHCTGMSLTNDAMNNVYARIGGNANGKKPVLMLDAHTDECGFMVQGIMENGLLSLIMLGGMDLPSIPAHTLLVRTRAGKLVKGITTSRPVHFMTDKEKSAPLDIREMFLDVGACSKKEAMESFGINIGDPAAPEVAFEYDEEHGLCFGKAFDNRMGCACIIHTLRALQAVKDDLAVEVVGAFASQEEVGMRGATVTSAQVQPDLAIVFEGSPADDFYYSPEKSQGGMHKGVQIRCMDKSYITNPAFLEYAHELGDTMGITYQDAVRRGGSTNAGKISLAGKAVPTLVLGIPSRYVHSHYNFCAIEDVESTVRMAVEVIKGLNEERIKHLMHQDILKTGFWKNLGKCEKGTALVWPAGRAGWSFFCILPAYWREKPYCDIIL